MTDREQFINDFRHKFYAAIGNFEDEIYLTTNEARNILQELENPTLVRDNNVHVNGWISVKDRMPEMHIIKIDDGSSDFSISDYVLVLTPDLVTIANLENDHDKLTWLDINDDPVEVTHWMPLPELPKEN